MFTSGWIDKVKDITDDAIDQLSRRLSAIETNLRIQSKFDKLSELFSQFIE